MSILKPVLIGLAGLAVLLVLIGFFLPSSVHVERATVIEAPRPTVFALLDSYRRFNEWSPWAQTDPGTRYEYAGAARGEGARMTWESDHPEVGTGSQEITASEPYSRLEVALDFGPQGTADAFYDLSEENGATRVVWGFDTDFGLNLMGRYFGLMMDGMIGEDFEEGLANLKELAESLPPADWSDLEVELVDVEPETIIYASGTSSRDEAAIGQALGAAYGQVAAFLARHSLDQAGPPLTITSSWSEDEGYVFDAGIPVAGDEIEVPEDAGVRLGETYGGRALRVVHTGPYGTLPATHDKIEAYVAAHGLERVDRPWDVWVSDPGSTPEDELVTHLYLPVE